MMTRRFRSVLLAATTALLLGPSVTLAVEPAEYMRNEAFALYYGGGDDKSKAIARFEEAAAAGDTPSMVFLGDLYEKGEYVPADRQKAIDWYLKAIAAGNQDAAKRLAKLAATPDAQAAAPKPVVEQPKQAEAPVAPAPPPEPSADDLFYEAFALFDFEAKDNSEAVEGLERAAEAGSTEASGWLGFIYRDAIGLPKPDYVKARTHSKIAAEAGDVSAMVTLAMLYGDGKGGKKSSKDYLYWMEKAAALDNVGALFQLGNAYFNGVIVKTDLVKAFDYQLRAADLGGADSNALIAFRYMYGDGTKKDFAKSAQHLFRAIKLGSEWAQSSLKDYATNRTVISHLQELLRENGFYDGSVDGSLGPQTRAAIDAAFNTEKR